MRVFPGGKYTLPSRPGECRVLCWGGMSKAKILIVDDDAKLSTLMRAFLECDGFEVREENRSFAAYSTAREFRPQLILLDVDMPGKDGGTVAAEIAADPALAPTPIIFVTSLVSRGESGMRGKERFLGKPVAPTELLTAVRQALPRVAA